MGRETVAQSNGIFALISTKNINKRNIFGGIGGPTSEKKVQKNHMYIV
jgi:hypothetical protein